MSQPILSTKSFCQVGLVVRDIERSLEAYCRLFGVPIPEIGLTDELAKARTVYRGQPTEARARLAFIDLGAVSLELIEPVGGPSTWREFLDAHGEGVHHIAFMVDDTPQAVEALAGQGLPAVQQGYYTGGMYTYIDSAPSLAVILELLQNIPSTE